MLIHCDAGQNRTAAIALAYAMIVREMTLRDAWIQLLEARTKAFDNGGPKSRLLLHTEGGQKFRQQLANLESTLGLVSSIDKNWIINSDRRTIIKYPKKRRLSLNSGSGGTASHSGSGEDGQHVRAL